MLVARARVRRELLFELVGDAFPFLGVRRRLLLGRYIGPELRIVGIDREPLFGARLGIRLDRLDRAFRLTDAAIDAFFRVNDEHVLALVEAIHGADFHTVHVFTFDAIVVDDVGHLHTLKEAFCEVCS